MKLIKYILLNVFFVLAVFSLFTQITQAQSPESFGLTLQQTLPGNSKYTLKRFKEKAIEFFKFTHKSKSAYREILLEKRLSELVSLIENKNINDVANSTQRFAYQAGKLAEGSYKDSSDRKNEIITLFEKYKPTLEKMRDNFPANSPFWLLSQHDINTLDILADKLK
ncbi:MAG: hypothetical protein AAB625_01955 [Patescibacteria group bacterium]